jgi:uncharacterized membrane protein
VRLLTWARNRFWFLPTLCAILAAALGVGLPELDIALRSENFALFFGGGPEGARALLSAIISSMISFTALVFSITIVVLQLTSCQFSPRVLRTFLRDRFNQLTLGVFVATFVYAMTVLRSVRGDCRRVALRSTAGRHDGVRVRPCQRARVPALPPPHGPDHPCRNDHQWDRGGDAERP